MAMLSDIRSDVPRDLKRLDQYFGAWAIEESRGQLLMSTVRGMNWAAHRYEVEAAAGQEMVRSKPGDFVVEDGIALIDVVGVITKYGSSLSEMEWGTVGLARAVRNARLDARVRGVRIYFDTPGGTVAGVDDLGREIAACAKEKPVVGVIGDLCASAGYWLASQCSYVICNPSGLVGSIGAYMVVEDMSGMAEKLGVRVHVVRAGEFKGMCTPGTEVTEAHLAELQRTVDGLNEFFLGAVKRGRGMLASAVKALADGRVHLAAEALRLGLIDDIGGAELAVRWIGKGGGGGVRGAARSAGDCIPKGDLGNEGTGEAPPAPPQAGGGGNSGGTPGLLLAEDPDRNVRAPLDEEEEVDDVQMGINGGAVGAVVGAEAPDKLEDSAMSEEKAPVAATFGELKALFPDAGAEWREGQVCAGATMAQAQQAYIGLLRERAASAEASAAAAQAEAAAVKAAAVEADAAAASKAQGPGATGGLGAQHVGTSAPGGAAVEGGGDAKAEFEALVDAEQARTKCTRTAAHQAVCRKNPDLRVRMVQEHNAAHGRAALAV